MGTGSHSREIRSKCTELYSSSEQRGQLPARTESEVDGQTERGEVAASSEERVSCGRDTPWSIARGGEQDVREGERQPLLGREVLEMRQRTGQDREAEEEGQQWQGSEATQQGRGARSRAVIALHHYTQRE